MAQAKLDSRDSRRLATTTTPAPMESGTHRRVLVRPVLEHPHPTLARPSVEVDPFDPFVVSVAAVLVATMRASPACVGLAAPQIGENIRVFAMNVTGHKKAKSCAGLVVLVNPRIVTSAGNVVMREGCTSVPHYTGDVARAREVIVAGLEPATGRTQLFTADGIEARCVQHEIDHLDGYLFVDRVQDPVAELFARKHYG
jgi:peptide deformylase